MLHRNDKIEYKIWTYATLKYRLCNRTIFSTCPNRVFY